VTITYLQEYGQAVEAQYPIAPNMPFYEPSDWRCKSEVIQWFAESREILGFSDNICYYAEKVHQSLFWAANDGYLSMAELSQMFSSLVDGDLIPRWIEV